MDIANSLLISVFGLSVVFAVLVSLIILIYVQSTVLNYFHKKQAQKEAAQIVPAGAEHLPAPSAGAVPSVSQKRPELKLYGVDEKTAALAMAIVCAESDVPANELIFKSIRLIGEK